MTTNGSGQASGEGGTMDDGSADGLEYGLIARVAGQDREALARLYDRSSGRVYGLALRILRDPAEAEETTLDVFMQVWRTASRFDPEAGSPTAWLCMLARSRAIDRVRRRRVRLVREEPLPEIGDPPAKDGDPEKMAVASQVSRTVRAALQKLPREQREVLELAYFSGLSHSELAARLGQPLGTVKTRIRSGMAKLREHLAVVADVQPRARREPRPLVVARPRPRVTTRPLPLRSPGLGLGVSA